MDFPIQIIALHWCYMDMLISNCLCRANNLKVLEIIYLLIQYFKLESIIYCRKSNEVHSPSNKIRSCPEFSNED